MSIKEKLELMDEIKVANEKYVEDQKMMQKTFKVVMIGGTVKKDMYTGMTHKDAVDICENYGWEVAPDGEGGFVWDLDIEEE